MALLQLSAITQATVEPHRVSPLELPEHLRVLGTALFGTQDALADIMANTISVDIKSAGEPIVLSMNAHDAAAKQLADEGHRDDYKLDSLPETQDKQTGMINFIDIGANLGLNVIVGYKKYQDKFRALAVEPVPTTYFYLQYNLWKNNVPLIDLPSSTSQAGVMALNAAVAGSPGKPIEICYSSTDSLVSRPGLAKDFSNQTCKNTTRATTGELFEKFGDSRISFFKIDCEGCEWNALGSIYDYPQQCCNRMAGELHVGDQDSASLEQLVCKHNSNSSQYFSKCGKSACNLPLNC
jgi:FkbM family methyltransferase